MKKSILGIGVGLAMIFALPALADASDQQTQQKQDQTEVDTSTDDQGSEYTDPKSESHAPAGSRTIKGEFVKKTGKQLWIKTGTGTETIQLNRETAMPENPPQEGDQIIVNYERTTQGVMLANSIRAASPDTNRGRVTMSESDQQSESAQSRSETETDRQRMERERAEQERERAEERREARDRLPQTASDLPLLALLGLLAIGGAVALRFAR